MRKIFQKQKNVPVTVKASIAYATCSVFQKCLSFITLPLFTRLLTTEEYGQYTIYQSWFGIFSIFLTLNLAYGSFSKAMIKFENDREGYVSSIEGICILLSVIFMLVYLPFQKQFNELFELPTAMICLMVVEILCCTGLQLWTGQKRFEYKYKLNVFLTILISVLSPALAVFLVKTSAEKGYARIIGYAVINCIVGGSFFVWNALRGKKIINAGYWKYALGFNLPLFTYYLSQVIFNQSDRIMISHMVGKDKAAIYGVAYSLATILTFVLNAINNSYVPWFYGKIKEGKEEDNKAISFGIALLMMILLSGIIWFAPEIIEIMAGSNYSEAKYVVPPVAVSIFLLFISQLFINVEFYYEDKKSLVRASIGAALVNLLLNWICIDMFGYIAAAYTTLVSYMIFAISNCIAMKKLLIKKEINDGAFDYKALIILSFVFACTTVIGAFLYEILIARIVLAVFVLIAIILKRNYFLLCLRRIKR